MRHLKIMVNRWIINRNKVSFALKYDLIPPTGKDNAEKARNIVYSLYDSSKQYQENHPDSFTPNESTKSGFVFDLVCKSVKSTVFVKFLDIEQSVTEQDLEKLKNEAMRYGGRSGQAEVIAVSSNPYADDAIAYAKKNDGQRYNAIFDLVIRNENGYYAVYVSERKIK